MIDDKDLLVVPLKMDNYVDEDEFLLLLLAEQHTQRDEFEDELLACVGLAYYGVEEA